MSLTESRRRPSVGTGTATTNTARTTNTPKRNWSAVPLIAVMYLPSVVMVGYAIAGAIGVIR